MELNNLPVLRQQLEEVFLHDPVAFQVRTMAMRDNLTHTQMLEAVVVCLSEARKRLVDEAVKRAMNECAVRHIAD